VKVVNDKTERVGGGPVHPSADFAAQFQRGHLEQSTDLPHQFANNFEVTGAGFMSTGRFADTTTPTEARFAVAAGGGLGPALAQINSDVAAVNQSQTV
jgi:hypothetical protein